MGNNNVESESSETGWQAIQRYDRCRGFCSRLIRKLPFISRVLQSNHCNYTSASWVLFGKHLQHLVVFFFPSFSHCSNTRVTRSQVYSYYKITDVKVRQYVDGGSLNRRIRNLPHYRSPIYRRPRHRRILCRSSLCRISSSPISPALPSPTYKQRRDLSQHRTKETKNKHDENL